MGSITRSFANLITANGPSTLPSGVGGSMIKIQTTTISSDVANVTIEPTNFTDYKTYCLIISRLQFGSDGMRMRMEIQDTSGATYRSDEYASRTGDGNPAEGSYFVMSWDNIGNNTSGSLIYEDYSSVIFMNGFEANRRFRYHGNCSYGDIGSVKRSFDIGGGTNYTEEVTGLKLQGTSGVLKSGQITLYGVGA